MKSNISTESLRAYLEYAGCFCNNSPCQCIEPALEELRQIDGLDDDPCPTCGALYGQWLEEIAELRQIRDDLDIENRALRKNIDAILATLQPTAEI